MTGRRSGQSGQSRRPARWLARGDVLLMSPDVGDLRVAMSWAGRGRACRWARGWPTRSAAASVERYELLGRQPEVVSLQ